MYQVPMTVWNELAASQPVSPKWGALFRLKQTELPAALDPVYAHMDSLKADSRVQRAFVLVAPLLVENESISAYLTERNLTSLRAAMPEVTSIPEAIALASSEFPMTKGQQATLGELLAQELAEVNRQPGEEATNLPAARAK